MTFVAVLVVSLLAVAGQRLIGVLVWGVPVFTRGFTGDASVHFAIIRHLSQSRRSRFIENYLIGAEPMSYPIAFHRFAALFSTSALSRRPWLPNMLLHLLGSAFLVTVAWLIGDGSLTVVAVTVAVYLALPSMWVFSGPGIAYLGLSERYLARLSCSGAYLGLAVGTVYDHVWLLAVGTGLASLGLISAQFARQALFFCVPILSLVLLDFRPVLLLALAVFLALLVGREHLWDGLRHTAMRWRLYRTRTKQSSHVRRIMLGYFRWDFRRGVSVKWIVYNLMEKDPTRSLFWYPELLLAGVMLATTPLAHSQLLTLALIPPVALYLLTLTERFNHLGEAYRYIEYNFTFLVPILVGLTFKEDTEQINFLYAYLSFTLAVILLRYTVQIKLVDVGNSRRNEISQFVQETGIEGPAVIFPVSMRLGADLVARRDDWKTFWWQPGTISEQIYDEYIEEYPFLKKNWKPLAARHGVTHIIVDKRQDKGMKDWQYDFSGEEKIAENENFVAYRVRTIDESQKPTNSAIAGARSLGADAEGQPQTG